MQFEIWITMLVGIISVVITVIITWHGTRKTSERIAEYIGGAIKAIHEDTDRTIRAIHESTEKTIRALYEDTDKTIKAIHEDIKASQAKLEERVKKHNKPSIKR